MHCLFYMVSSGAKSNYFLKAAHHKFLDQFPPCSRKQNYLWACYYLVRVSSFECLDCLHFGHFSSKAPHTIIPHLSHLFSLPLVPDDQSLKVFRAEANLGLRRFSDALTDLDYLCCLRPSWTEVRTERSQPDAVCLCCLCGSFVRTTKADLL